MNDLSSEVPTPERNPKTSVCLGKKRAEDDAGQTDEKSRRNVFGMQGRFFSIPPALEDLPSVSHWPPNRTGALQ